MTAFPHRHSQLTYITVAQATAFLKTSRNYLASFDALEILDCNVAEVLSAHSGALSFPSVSGISREAAKALARQRGWLYLRGVTTLLDETLEALVKHQGEGIDLSGLPNIAERSADLIVNYKSRMRLGLVEVSDVVAECLAAYEGIDLQLDSLRRISESGLALLRSNPRVRIPQKSVNASRSGNLRLLTLTGDLREDLEEATSRFLAEEPYAQLFEQEPTAKQHNSCDDRESPWPATVSHLSDDAVTQDARGNFAHAEQLFANVVELVTQACGASSIAAAIAISNLGLFYAKRSLGRKAEPYLSDALRILAVYGEPSPQVASALYRLSLLDSRDSESFCRRARSIREQYSNSNRCLEYQAILSRRDGNNILAEKLFSNLVAVKGAALQPSTAEGVWAAYNLALLKMQRSCWREAQVLWAAVAKSRSAFLDASHPAVDWCLSQLATALRQQGQHEALESVLQERLAIRERTVGLRDPESIQLLVDLGDEAGHKQAYRQSDEYFAMALDGVESSLGLRSGHQWPVLLQLTRSYLRHARLDEAERLCGEAWKRCRNIGSASAQLRKEFGRECWKCCDAQAWLVAYQGYESLRTGDLKTAEYHLRTAVAMRSRGSEFIGRETLDTLLDMAGKYFQRGAFTTAKRIHKRVLKQRQASVAGNDAFNAWTRVCLAVSCCHLADAERATRYLKKAFAGHQGRGGKLQKSRYGVSPEYSRRIDEAAGCSCRGLGEDGGPLREQRWLVFESAATTRGTGDRGLFASLLRPGRVTGTTTSDSVPQKNDWSNRLWHQIVQRILVLFGRRS